ncbi:MAG: NAD(+)/NADH kinase [Planctomycetales bacterium]|nr:NAD(+)/NADH kinase [Planctomycetales bacterium]
MNLSAACRPRVVILSANKESVQAASEHLRSVIAVHADIVHEEHSNDADLSAIDADFVIVVGGDGSILRAAKQMGTRQLPVLGVNLGKLGFLADVSVEHLASSFREICAGHYRVIDHLMFTCQVLQNGHVVAQELGLNETSILGGPPYSILEINLFVDSELVTTYSCDGLIIATPIGSTAHSLSAGGPILRKSLQAFVISAISPHTLTVRPVVDTADRVYEMSVVAPNESTSVVVDGQPLHSVTKDTRIRIQRADVKFQLIEIYGHGYYRTLREKLGWGGKLRQIDS